MEVEQGASLDSIERVCLVYAEDNDFSFGYRAIFSILSNILTLEVLLNFYAQIFAMLCSSSLFLVISYARASISNVSISSY